jgi:glutaredoxin/cytochrome c biogenesis protein CcdA
VALEKTVNHAIILDMKRPLTTGFLVIFFLLLPFVSDAQVTEQPSVFMFGRDDCTFCKAQFEFLNSEGISYQYLNIVESNEAATLYDQVVEKHELTRVTPITVIGETVLLGFDSPRTTGIRIKEAIQAAQSSDIRTIEDHIALAPKQTVEMMGGCSGLSCEGRVSEFTFDLPLIGVVDLQTFSLFSLSLVLGVIDGFNPCAMWVLVTFLTLLSQAGSRKKMIFLAGLFILAQGIMYNLILNVWYKTWDFVALDQYVTPLVGILALGGGLFFLWRWHKNKKTELVCDITDLDSQMKTIDKFKEVVNSPITLASVAAILVIAFSVNIIEFACSIGIPQAYTKILELNLLTFFERQWYIMIFTLGYMFDDVLVFGLAIWGYSKLQAHGGKYAQWSLLIGGVLMLLLGLLLIINPSLLVL